MPFYPKPGSKYKQQRGMLVGTPLTERERQVADLLCDGHNTESVGHQLSITIETVKRHMSNISAKLRVNSIVEIVIIMLNRKHEQEKAHLQNKIDELIIEMARQQNTVNLLEVSVRAIASKGEVQ